MRLTDLTNKGPSKRNAMNPFVSESVMPHNEEMMTIAMEFEETGNTADMHISPDYPNTVQKAPCLYAIREKIYMDMIHVGRFTDVSSLENSL